MRFVQNYFIKMKRVSETWGLERCLRGLWFVLRLSLNGVDGSVRCSVMYVNQVITLL